MSARGGTGEGRGMSAAKSLAGLLCLGGSLLIAGPILAQDKASGKDEPPAKVEPVTPLTVPEGQWLQLFDGVSLKGWKPTGEGEFQFAGKVEIKEGAIALGEGGPYTGITWEDGFPREDYEVEWKGMRANGTDIFGGLTVPVGEDHVTFVMGGWSDSVVGLSNVDGMNASDNICTESRSFENRRWYAFRITVTRDKIQAFIDDQEVIDLERTGHRFSIYSQLEPNQPIGFFTWYTEGALREIRMRRLPAPPGP